MKEQDIEHYAKEQFPIIPCNLCGSQENMQRSQIKQLLRSWEREYSGRIESLFSSLQKIAPPHLANTQLFDFVNLCGNW